MNNKYPVIPWAQPKYWNHEKEYVIDALDSTWISGGSYIHKLESKFSSWLGVDCSLTVSSGTAAINLAFLGLNLQRGDEVVIPGFCFLAAANIAIQMGLKPVFADVDKKTWCLTVDNIRSVCSSKTKAVVLVHTYGNSSDIESIVSYCHDKGIYVIEDVAEAIGTKVNGKLLGSYGDISCFSFQATKTITSGEGGMVVTNIKKYYDNMKLYRSHGMNKRRYWHEVAGNNFRLTNLQAALVYAQFEERDRVFSSKINIYTQYIKRLHNIKGVGLQKIDDNITPVIWAVAIKVSSKYFQQGRDKLMSQMMEQGVETRPGFYAASIMQHLYEINLGKLPISEDLGENIICLPIGPSLSDDNINYICDVLSGLKQ